MLALIATLVDRGIAYPTPDGSVYFRVRRFPGYGKLSHRRLDDMEAGEEIDAAKEDAHDFALWKGRQAGRAVLGEPMGRRTSGLAPRVLGDGGALPRAAVRHPRRRRPTSSSRTTRTRSRSPRRPRARRSPTSGCTTAWSPSAAEKMSKSLGNIRTIAELAGTTSPEALRLLFLGTHYRAPLEFSAGRLEEAARALERLYETLARADELLGPAPPPVVDGELATPAPGLEVDFCATMDDDLNAARGLGVIFERVRELNRLLDAGTLEPAAALRRALGRTGAALGLLTRPPAHSSRNRGPGGGNGPGSTSPRSRLP